MCEVAGGAAVRFCEGPDVPVGGPGEAEGLKDGFNIS